MTALCARTTRRLRDGNDVCGGIFVGGEKERTKGERDEVDRRRRRSARSTPPDTVSGAQGTSLSCPPAGRREGTKEERRTQILQASDLQVEIAFAQMMRSRERLGVPEGDGTARGPPLTECGSRKVKERGSQARRSLCSPHPAPCIDRPGQPVRGSLGRRQ